MMRWNGLGRSLLFGAFAAAAYIPFSILATPILGWTGAVGCYAALSAAAYLAGLGPTLRQGFAAALLLTSTKRETPAFTAASAIRADPVAFTWK